MTLGAILGKALIKPHSNHDMNWKDNIVQVKGCEGSQVDVGVNVTPLFPLTLTDNPVVIVGYNYK